MNRQHKKFLNSKYKNIFTSIFGIILILLVFIMIIILMKTLKPSSSTTASLEAQVESLESEVESFEAEKDETAPSIEDSEIIHIEQQENETAETETEPPVDHTKEITSTQYTLGEGVRARLLPSNDGEIFKVIYDIYSEVGVIAEGTDWYTCCIDNTVCYINARYIGDEEDVEYVKDKRAKQAALEAKRKASAYYTIFQNMTSEEYDLLAQIVALEAGNQTFEGKVAVIEVIMNRCISKDPNWPDTVKEVIYQKGQFATVKYLSHPYAYPGDSEYDAINYVKDNGATVIRSYLDKEGYDDISSLDYIYFATYHANGVGPVIHIGGHYFSRISNKAYQRSR